MQSQRSSVKESSYGFFSGKDLEKKKDDISPTKHKFYEIILDSSSKNFKTIKFHKKEDSPPNSNLSEFQPSLSPSKPKKLIKKGMKVAKKSARKLD